MTSSPVLVVDFDAQYAQLIARRVREANVYSELVPHTATVAEMLACEPAAIILSGGPSSVYEPGAPQVDPALFDTGVPVLGICYGFQAMARALGGEVTHTGLGEFGGTPLTVRGGVLLRDLPAAHSVWMSHGDCVTAAPDGFTVTADSPGSPVAAFEDRAELDHRQHHRRAGRRDPGAGRQRSGDLWSVRRGRLGGGRGAGAPRRPRAAHLRLRRPRPAARRRGRAG